MAEWSVAVDALGVRCSVHRRIATTGMDWRAWAMAWGAYLWHTQFFEQGPRKKAELERRVKFYTDRLSALERHPDLSWGWVQWYRWAMVLFAVSGSYVVLVTVATLVSTVPAATFGLTTTVMVMVWLAPAASVPTVQVVPDQLPAVGL